jgi:hypothetical protein
MSNRSDCLDDRADANSLPESQNNIESGGYTNLWGSVAALFA